MANYRNILTGLILLVSSTVYGQRYKIENLPNYDYSNYHFGFLLGLNEMHFTVKTPPKDIKYDSLMIIKPVPEKGFNIGIVSNLRIGKMFDLRFIPSLSFGDRNIEYTILVRDTVRVTEVKKTESTFIDFPLYLKFKSARLTNTRAYIFGGFRYSIDLASQSKKESDSGEILLKLKRNDLSGELGVGFDFYLPYFKFATEIKMSYGLFDLLERENNIYTNSIKRLSSKIFQLSFTFE